MQTEQHVAGPVPVYYNSVQYDGPKQWYLIPLLGIQVWCSLNLLGTGVNIPGDEGSGLVDFLAVASVWKFQDSCSCKFKPRYFAVDTCSST